MQRGWVHCVFFVENVYSHNSSEKQFITLIYFYIHLRRKKNALGSTAYFRIPSVMHVSLSVI